MFSSALLHWIAAGTMLLDHIGAFVFHDEFPILRIIGRIAFPLYALMIAEGFRHTRSWSKYFVRVLILALVSQIPILIISIQIGYMLSLNILFGFALAILALKCIRWGWRGILITAVATIAVAILKIDYSILTILLPVFFYLAQSIKEAPLRIIVSACTILFALSFQLIDNPWFATPYILLAIPFVCLYNGKKGSLAAPRWIRYSFYPLHLFAIAIMLWII
jgi:hypothetical protein